MRPTSRGSSSRGEASHHWTVRGTRGYPSDVDSEPEYMICVDCESPSYTFEWTNGKFATILCEVCGNDDPADFVTESEYEDMTAP